MATVPGSKLAAAMKGGDAQLKQRSPYEIFRNQLNLVRRDIVGLVGERNIDKFVRICLNSVQYNPKLLTADRRTLMLACMDAAQDGLMPDGNEAVFNIYPTKTKDAHNKEVWVDTVQYLPMAYGLVQKIYESGATKVDAVAVYAKDEFLYQRGDEPKIVHVPYAGSEEPGNVIAAYCIVEYPKLATKREVMFQRDIEKVKSKSKAKDGLMWKDFYDQAAIKSVIHRINKQLPQSERLNRVLVADNRAMGLADVEVPVDHTGTDFAALVDGTLDAQMREIPGKVVEGEVVGEKKEEGAPAKLAPGALAAREEAEAVARDQTAFEERLRSEGPPPKPGDAGTPELKAKFLGQIERATAKDVLDIVMDDVRFYAWAEGELSEITERYKAKAGAISGG